VQEDIRIVIAKSKYPISFKQIAEKYGVSRQAVTELKNRMRRVSYTKKDLRRIGLHERKHFKEVALGG